MIPEEFAVNHSPTLGYKKSMQTRINALPRHGYGAHERVRATRILNDGKGSEKDVQKKKNDKADAFAK